MGAGFACDNTMVHNVLYLETSEISHCKFSPKFSCNSIFQNLCQRSEEENHLSDKIMTLKIWNWRSWQFKQV